MRVPRAPFREAKARRSTMWHRRPSGWRAAGLLLCAAVLALFVAAPASADWPGWGRLTVVSVAVTPSDPTLQTGQTMQLKATATFGDGTTRDVTKKAAW